MEQQFQKSEEPDIRQMDRYGQHSPVEKTSIPEPETCITDIGVMLAAEREELFEQLTIRVRTQKRWRLAAQVLFWTGLSTVIVLYIAKGMGLIEHVSNVTLPIICCYSAASIAISKLEGKLGKTATKFALFDDIRAVGPLMESLVRVDQSVVNIAEKSLMSLFPRLQANDVSRISGVQFECLYRRLKMKLAASEADFIISALMALQQIGDATAIPYVEALASSLDASAKATRVREAALFCLPRLKARVEQSQLSHHLLRASSAIDTQTESLLRPISGIHESDPEHLLRASSDE